jgi:ribosomal protein S18 acetylase RimI-like enzyme
MKGAVIVCNPDIPLPPCNHVADIKVNENEAENLLNKAVGYFKKRNSVFARFRITPLTRPKTFSKLLEANGFDKEAEDSIMVFKGKISKDKFSKVIKVRKMPESQIDVADTIVFKVFEFSDDWKDKWHPLMVDWMRNGGEYYVGSIRGKPAGTSLLFSLIKTGGIFNVGTLKEYRRQGIATALTLHAVRKSIEKGNELHTLQTTRGGNAEQLYKKIGFVTDHTISWYAKKL